MSEGPWNLASRSLTVLEQLAVIWWQKANEMHSSQWSCQIVFVFNNLSINFLPPFTLLVNIRIDCAWNNFSRFEQLFVFYKIRKNCVIAIESKHWWGEGEPILGLRKECPFKETAYNYPPPAHQLGGISVPQWYPLSAHSSRCYWQATLGRDH